VNFSIHLHQGWISIVDGDDDNDKEEAETGGGGEVDPRRQARFTQSVSSLQFLGFVKPSKRKTDHVQRLTWAA
jgi:hypothetical protein